MKKDLTIIIVTFNSSEIIERCLSNLGNKASELYDIFIVDNNSRDNTVEIVSQKFPEVKIIKNRHNIGFGRANNIALRQAETDFALILNPDAFITKDNIAACIDTLKSNSKIAIAGPKTFSTKEAANEYDESKFNNPSYHQKHFVVGGIMFLRIEVFRKIGFFDEEYFMFTEDNEICDRSIANGFVNALICNAKAYHLGASSSKKTLHNYFRRFWHLGWSKAKYKQGRKNKFSMIRSTMRIVTIYLFESLFYFLIGNLEKSVSKFGFAYGNLCFLVGVKAFKKDSSPRI